MAQTRALSGEGQRTARQLAGAALSRRGFLAGASALTGTLLASDPAFALPAATDQLDRLMDRLWDEQLRRFPELASLPAAGGRRPGLDARLSDWSRAGRDDWAGWARSAVRRIAAIDPAVLPQEAEANRAILLDRFGRIATLTGRYRFGAAAAEPDAPVAPYAISVATGPHLAIPALLRDSPPLASRADGEAWLARLAGFAPALDAASQAFRIDAAAGVIPPAQVLDRTLEQLQALRSPAPAAHPLLASLDGTAAIGGEAGSWRLKASALLERAVYPAIDRQIATLAAARDRAPVEAGAWALPDGARFYADALAWHTGAGLDAAAAHALGCEQVARLSAELDGLLAAQGLVKGSVGARLRALGRRPDEAFPADAGGRAAVLAACAQALEQVRPRLPDLFAVAAPARLAVAPLPAELAGQRAEACVLGGQLNGTQPGTVYLNLQDLDAWPRYSIASTAFHGSIPAHLRDDPEAGAAAALPPLRRCGLRYSACADGWSLYAGQVVDEQGLYAGDGASRIGYLRTRLLHAARLVADTGLNDRRWTLAQTAAWLADTTGLDPLAARREVEAMAALPGKASAHAVGQAEWLRLRTLAQRIAGPAFDQRRFHQLIQFGEAPFAVLEELVASTFTRRRSVLVTRRV